MADLVIRNGTIVDGTGAPPFPGDVAIQDGRITEVAPRVDGRAHREIDAEGLLVTPGFVDIHTHYDGQATWDPVLAPSALHGVTSLVMGNCGVGFAPAARRDDHHQWLIGVLEGVEDIPGTALTEGLTWDWESFPDYLDALDRRTFALDVGTQVAHVPLRSFVMGERGADPHEGPTAEELGEMARLTREGIEAGALGFTTSRTEAHRTSQGAPLGTRYSTADELLGIATGLAEAGAGVIQLITDAYLSTDEEFVDSELALLRALAETSGRPLSMTVQQPDRVPDRWRRMLDFVAACVSDGLAMRAQVAPRPIGVIQGLEASVNPFLICSSYQEVAGLPLAERVVAMQDPDRRAAVVAQHQPFESTFSELFFNFDKLFRLNDPVDYEPDPSTSVTAIAGRSGESPAAVAYDMLLEEGGRRLLYMPLANWARRDLSDTREMLLSPHTLLGLSDGGAHCGAICDASFPTTTLAHWGRDRTRGEGLPLPLLVHHLTQRVAAHVGWNDRGVLAAGYRGDVNVIDFDALRLHPPYLVRDLPAGGRRLMQKAEGYRATIKAGVATFEDGEHTGALPGRLVRGAQATPRP